jgi:hypothetical protein
LSDDRRVSDERPSGITEHSNGETAHKAAALDQPVGFRALPDERGFTIDAHLPGWWVGFGEPSGPGALLLLLGFSIGKGILDAEYVPDPLEIAGLVLAGGMFLVGALLTLAWLLPALVIVPSRTARVRVSKGHVSATLRALGIPVRWRRIPARDIEQLYVRDEGGWRVLARTRDNQVVRLTPPLQRHAQAHYVERATEDALGIANDPRDDPPELEPPVIEGGEPWSWDPDDPDDNPWWPY